ncbi:MAG: ammonium transporter [Dehalococcoidia bacterium]
MFKRTSRKSLVVLLGLMIFLTSFGIAFAQDSSGAETLAGDPNAPVNFTWVLICGALVFFMQAGFAFLGAGLIRSKNTVNYLTKSFMDFAMASLSFWAFGFALMFGGSALGSGLDDGNAILGFSGFFLTSEAYDVNTILLWAFQMMFAGTAATIVAGAVAERMKITAYLAYAFLIVALVYPIYGHWLWGGGWISTMDVPGVDFAGSGVVHAIGGLAALAGAILVGPRLGRFNPDGSVNDMPGHNVTFVVIGTFILFFGWFGFNTGSTLAATELRTSIIFTNTLLAGASGAVVAMYYGLARTGKADVLKACNGALAGLVAITAPCAWVSPWAALVIGGLGALVMLGATSLLLKAKVDDVVGAFPVHGATGIWGVLAVGIFADGTYGNYTTDAPYITGLLYGGFDQFIAQLISVGALIGWGFGASFLVFALIKYTIGLRATREEELEGLDVPEHGTPAYPVAVEPRAT